MTTKISCKRQGNGILNNQRVAKEWRDARALTQDARVAAARAAPFFLLEDLLPALVKERHSALYRSLVVNLKCKRGSLRLLRAAAGTPCLPRTEFDILQLD
jgi:hypothetical protein